ncbi:MAG: hypothetical protein AB1714_06960 [Acidobacteriota bacterium]
MIDPFLSLFISERVERWVLADRKADAERTSDGTGWVVRYGRRTRLLWAALTAFFGLAVAFGIVARMFDKNMGTALTIAYLALFGTCCICSFIALINAHTRQVLVYHWGLIARSFWRERFRASWSEIAEISHSPSVECVRMTTISGRRVRISLRLSGLGRLRDHIERYAPHLAAQSSVRALPMLPGR